MSEQQNEPLTGLEWAMLTHYSEAIGLEVDPATLRDLVRRLLAENAIVRNALIELGELHDNAGNWCESAVCVPGTAWHLTLDEHTRLEEAIEQAARSLAGGAPAPTPEESK